MRQKKSLTLLSVCQGKSSDYVVRWRSGKSSLWKISTFLPFQKWLITIPSLSVCAPLKKLVVYIYQVFSILNFRASLKNYVFITEVIIVDSSTDNVSSWMFLHLIQESSYVGIWIFVRLIRENVSLPWKIWEIQLNNGVGWRAALTMNSQFLR